MENIFFSDPGELADVQSGQPWSPEPAARYNAVNAMLRESFRFTPRQTPEIPGRECRILCRNQGTAAIPRYSAVVVTNVQILDSGELFCTVEPASPTAVNWGIAAEEIRSGKSAPVVFQGVLKVSGVEGVPRNYAGISSTGKLGFAISGRAEILWTDRQGNALLLLSGTSGPEYHGQFKVVYRRPGVVAVINGSDPASTTAGYTDFGSLPTQEINVGSLPEASYHTICLVAEYTGAPETPMITATCRLSIAVDNYPTLCGRVELATVADNGRSISQIWQDGSVCWAGRYVL